MSQQPYQPNYRRDLGDGLVARWSTAADIEGIAELYSNVFRGKLEDPPNERMMKWARDLGSNRHPSANTGDFAVVEDTRSNTIVAALVVLQQGLTYDDVVFTIGRPEAVASHPEYRNRGLVRAIFEMLHARSEQRGDLAQAITGISYFYRQFEYEYAIDLGGERRLPLSTLPELAKDTTEPYQLRRATRADLLELRVLYERECRNPLAATPLVTTPFDETYWNWVLGDQNPESGQGFTAYMLVDAAGANAGYVLGGRLRWGQTYPVFGISTHEGVPLFKAVPSILRNLKQIAETTPPWRDEGKSATSLTLMLGDAHQVYGVLSEEWVTRAEKPYAWYVRVPDVPAFIRHIAPVLEQRLAHSLAAGYSGECKLDFYRSGLKLVFEQGKLTTAEPWRRPAWGDRGQAGFPPLVFLQLLFGRRSLDELRHAFPDVWAEEEQAVLLNALFPKRHSWTLPQD